MSSCRKPKIQNDLSKHWSKSVFMFISSCFTTIQLNFKNSEIKKLKSYASSGIRTRNPCGLRLRNTCAIGCTKKTAENVFKLSYVLFVYPQFISYFIWVLHTQMFNRVCQSVSVNLCIVIHSFLLRANSVHCHECSPFWVGISTICL